MGRSKSQGGMGFRDLDCFSRALLAKQCWRLVQYPQSLAAQIIKAKYYPKASLVEAKLGSRPSLAWQSILSTKPLFHAGMIWRIGDGRPVKIWGDKWLPKPMTYTIQCPCRQLDVDATVAELIDRNTGGWNISLIHSIFWTEEAEIICNLPLSRYYQSDKMIWLATSTGVFTVQSTYYLENKRKNMMAGEGSNQARSNGVWKNLWNLQVPNSTKVFLWRACNNIIPTKDNLRREE